jgi:hypothetical protein
MLQKMHKNVWHTSHRIDVFESLKEASGLRNVTIAARRVTAGFFLL